MTFKLWSDVNSEAKNVLQPDFGLRPWDKLSADEKNTLWQHLQTYFFIKTREWAHNVESKYTDGDGHFFKFYKPNSEEKRNRINVSIESMNYYHKAKNYANNFLENPIHYFACVDFYSIFMKKEGHAVIELLSFYCKTLIQEREKGITKNQNENDKTFKQRQEKWKWEEFDEFSKDLNEVFSSFGLNVYLTRNGFVPKQEEKIIKDIYEPVLNFLSHTDWKDVNRLLADAFSEYRRQTPNGYSTCVTHTVSAVQAFLQILVNKKIGVGEISKLIPEAQKQNLIPSDTFTKEIFKNIEAVLMRERQETGDPHPKQAYATDKNARMVLNLAMVFFQHCIA